MEPLGKINFPISAQTKRSHVSQHHVFNSALCLGTLVLRDPGNVLAGFVLAQLDAAITAFTSLLQHGGHTPRYKSNLRWLVNLRARAQSKITEASRRDGPQRDGDQERSSGSDGDGHGEHDEDVELLGWRTRLIERAGQGSRKTSRTIHPTETPTESPATDTTNLGGNYMQGQMGIQDTAILSEPLPAVPLDPTNDMVRSNDEPLMTVHN